MKCEECQVLLEEYLDGELEKHAAGAMSVHIASCQSCNEALRQLVAEQQAYASYERGIEVSPALWSSVRSRLDEQNPPGPWQRWQHGFSNLFSLKPFNAPITVALVLLAVVLTVSVMKYLDRQDGQEQIAAPTDQSTASQSTVENHPVENQDKNTQLKDTLKEKELKTNITTVPRRTDVVRGKPALVKRDVSEPQTAAQLVHEAERKYLSAIALLNRDVKQHPSRLDSDARAKLDGALVAIDRTIAATRAAVKRNPNDPVAAQYMLSAYRKKVDVLKEMTSY
ncbi:MAG: anti-sigma factor family protein [Pyrinomonadaceae bacterium]